MTAFLVTADAVWAALSEVYDPELGINVVDLGLVYGVTLDGRRVQVTMTLTTPGCPLHDSLVSAVEESVRLFVPMVEAVAVELGVGTALESRPDQRCWSLRAWLELRRLPDVFGHGTRADPDGLENQRGHCALPPAG